MKSSLCVMLEKVIKFGTFTLYTFLTTKRGDIFNPQIAKSVISSLLMYRFSKTCTIKVSIGAQKVERIFTTVRAA
jgi:hypothetical protein